MTAQSAAERNADLGHFGRCQVCQKVRYRSRKAAKAAIRRMSTVGRDGKLKVYGCDGWFHIGHQPSVITRGEVDRRSYDRPRRPVR